MNAAASTQFSGQTLRVATYNIHKGVRGVGPRKRLEIHNLGGSGSRRSTPTSCSCRRCGTSTIARRAASSAPRSAGRDEPQADFLAPEGYEVAYRTNAVTRGGEHGNVAAVALAARRGGPPRRVGPSFRAAWLAARAGGVARPHVARHRRPPRADALRARAPGRPHRGVHRGRGAGRGAHRGRRRLQRLERSSTRRCARSARARQPAGPRAAEDLSVAGAGVPLDRIYTRGFACRGTAWARMSDHLPFIAELEPA